MVQEPGPLAEALSVLKIGRRLALLLAGVAAYCVTAGLIVQWCNLNALNWGNEATLTSTAVLSLLMGFRNRVAFSRWWEGRTLWGKLTNDSRNLAAKLAAFVPIEALARSRAAESIVGFAEALKRRLRDEPTRLRDLPGFEEESADPEHVPLHLAGRQFAAVGEWQRDGLVPAPVLWVLDEHLRGLLDVCGGCEKIRYTPVSPSYKTLLRTGLLLNILAEPWLSIPEIGFWGLPVFLILCFFLLGLELIDTIVEEPFGRERDDLDLDRYCQTIRDSVRACLPPAKADITDRK